MRKMAQKSSQPDMFLKLLLMGDDQTGKTLASCSSLVLKEMSGDKTARAHSVGKELAQRAKQAGVESAVFDRGRFKFHGRVKALAEGLREGGLQV